MAHHRGPLGVAVSGGGDSMALLDLARDWAIGAGVAVHAVTFDHDLRQGSAEEAAFVGRICADFGISHHVLRWQRSAPPISLLAEARAARYGAISAWAQDAGVTRVLLGHTRDDVAETFLMRLSRAAGVDGLAAMAPDFSRDGMCWGRPLLGVSREDLRHWLRIHGLPWVEDPSNDNPRFERVRIRQALAGLDAMGLTREAIAHSAAAMADARDALQAVVAREWKIRVRLQGGDLLIADAADPIPDIERRLLLAALRIVGGAVWPPRHGGLADLQARLAAGQRSHTLGGCLVTRKGGDLRIGREARAVAGLSCAPDGWWDGRWSIRGHVPKGAHLAALGAGISLCPDWRATGLPHASQLAGPALWLGDRLIAAPLAGFGPGFTAHIREGFARLHFAH